jgi:hypothetical protein
VKEDSAGIKHPSMMERLAASLASQQKTTPTRHKTQIIDFKTISQEALTATYQKKSEPIQSKAQLRQPIPDTL